MKSNEFACRAKQFSIALALPLLAIVLLTSCQKKSQPIASEKTGDPKVANASPIHTSQVLFNGGNEGVYHSFRIPSIIKTNAGTLLAFAEGRKANPGDFGDINLVYKRSTDNGNTWSGLLEVVGTGPGTWGNPTAVVDRSNGRVWLFMSWNDSSIHKNGDVNAWGKRRVYASWSDNDGVSWATPLNLTSTLLPPDFKWDAMGPGIGIQTQFDHPGRLIIPAISRNIYSDDHGATWQYALTPGNTNEGTVVELMDGRLYRNDRPNTNIWNTTKKRFVSTGSIENGFPAFAPDNALTDPKCQASMLRYNVDAPHRIYFLNPNDVGKRCNMTVRISYDDGQTWAKSRAIYDWNTCDYAPITVAKGGYTSMIKTADFCVGALIEINENVHASSTSNKSIEFHKFNLPWILNGTTEP